MFSVVVTVRSDVSGTEWGDRAPCFTRQHISGWCFVAPYTGKSVLDSDAGSGQLFAVPSHGAATAAATADPTPRRAPGTCPGAGSAARQVCFSAGRRLDQRPPAGRGSLPGGGCHGDVELVVRRCDFLRGQKNSARKIGQKVFRKASMSTTKRRMCESDKSRTIKAELLRLADSLAEKLHNDWLGSSQQNFLSPVLKSSSQLQTKLTRNLQCSTQLYKMMRIA